ncbi:hypothetical protein RZS08_28885, partial [Arthrospira platensis SPKY1]|nr:hypothetical protein [Arthrospira platensis SPKY1]
MSQTASLSLPPQFILVTEAFTYKASDKDGDCLPRDTNPSWAMYRIDQAALDARQHHFNESARTHAIVRPPYRAGLTAPVGYGAVGEGAYLDAAAMQHLATQPVLTEIKASPTGTCTEREGGEPEREFACIITHECHYKPEKVELYVFAGEPPLQILQR